MKYIVPVLIFLLSTTIARNFNNSIQGKITEENSGESLAGVNVYFSETTIGTMSAKNGTYILENVKPGFYELIVSCIGYEPNTYKIEVKQNKHFNINFQMKIKSYQLEELTVITNSHEDWEEKYDIFIDSFLGDSDFSDNCEIINPNTLQFNEAKNGFTASTTKPLILLNKDLGYKLHIELFHYQYKYSNKEWRFQIKPRFYELASSPESDKLSNRQTAYQGSEREFWEHIDSIATQGAESDYNIWLYTRSKRTYRPVIQLETILPKSQNWDKSMRTFEFRVMKVEYRPTFFDYRESILKLNGGILILDKNGYALGEYPYKVYGYWATLGVANMLPKDFVPQNN